MMTENPLLKLQIFGQSIWLDFIRRQMITSGELQQLIDEDGVRGVTSNPSIFEKAIGGSHDLETLNAYRDHGRPAARLEEDTVDAYRTLQHLHEIGIDIDAVTQQLEDAGIEKFIQPFDCLMQTLEEKRRVALKEAVGRQASLGAYQEFVDERIARLE